MNYNISASREVLEEHSKRHAEQHGIDVDDLVGIPIRCPCERTQAWICDTCNEPIFMAFRRSDGICEHGQELINYEAWNDRP